MKTQSIAVLAASLLLLAVSTPAFSQETSGDAAQTGEDQATTDDSESSSEAGGQSAKTGESEASSDAAGEQNPDQSAAADGAEATTAKSAETANADGAADKDKAGSNKNGANDDASKPKTGPGGKKLREDYPGTDESKKARMDTERIDGLSFEDGDDSDEAYDMRVRELETKVDDLKEKVFRSKSRIVLLKETVLTGNVAGSRAIVSHRNSLGGAYTLQRAHYSLDGARIYNKTGEKADLDDSDKIELYNGSITPGSHRVSILLELKGSGYGLFNYMEGYKFTLKDSCEFTAREGRSTTVKVSLIDQGGAMAAYKDRPGVECVVDAVKLTGDDLNVAKSDKNQSDGSDEPSSDQPSGDQPNKSSSATQTKPNTPTETSAAASEPTTPRNTAANSQ